MVCWTVVKWNIGWRSYNRTCWFSNHNGHLITTFDLLFVQNNFFPLLLLPFLFSLPSHSFSHIQLLTMPCRHRSADATTAFVRPSPSTTHTIHDVWRLSWPPMSTNLKSLQLSNNNGSIRVGSRTKQSLIIIFFHKVWYFFFPDFRCIWTFEKNLLWVFFFQIWEQWVQTFGFAFVFVFLDFPDNRNLRSLNLEMWVVRGAHREEFERISLQKVWTTMSWAEWGVVALDHLQHGGLCNLSFVVLPEMVVLFC